MEIIHQRRAATAAEVHTALPSPPSYSAVRALLSILENKGHLIHKKEGLRYIYLPTESRQKASRSALKRVLSTFFEGSVSQAVAALLSSSDVKLSNEELNRLQQIIKQARKEGG